jgi:hypothetical protein
LAAGEAVVVPVPGDFGAAGVAAEGFRAGDGLEVRDGGDREKEEAWERDLHFAEGLGAERVEGWGVVEAVLAEIEFFFVDEAGAAVQELAGLDRDSADGADVVDGPGEAGAGFAGVVAASGDEAFRIQAFAHQGDCLLAEEDGHLLLHQGGGMGAGDPGCGALVCPICGCSRDGMVRGSEQSVDLISETSSPFLGNIVVGTGSGCVLYWGGIVSGSLQHSHERR